VEHIAHGIHGTASTFVGWMLAVGHALDTNGASAAATKLPTRSCHLSDVVWADISGAEGERQSTRCRYLTRWPGDRVSTIHFPRTTHNTSLLTAMTGRY